MTPFHRIVVPIDRSDRSLRALKPARVIADFVGADLVVASVVAKAIDREPVERELASRLVDCGVAVSDALVVVNGYTIAQGLEPVIAEPGLLVVVATDGHSRTVAFTGSVAEELVHAREGEPTLLVGPSVDIDHVSLAGPMVLCRDPEHPSPAAEAVAERLARQLLMQHTVLSIRRPGRFRGRGPDRRATSADGDGGADGADRADGAGGSEGADDDVDRPVVLSDTDPTRSIIGYAENVGALVIAVGTHRRVGLSRMAFGSVAIQTVTDASCPVLAIPESD